MEIIYYIIEILIKKNSDSQNNIKMINNNKNVLDIYIFTKLLKATQDLNNFENYKILFLCSSHFFIQ